MPAIDPSAYLRQIRPILGALKTPVVESVPHAGGTGPRRPAYPFLTISREAGTGAWSLAERLMDRLNEGKHLDPPWTCWDRELVEKVASEHNIARELVEALEESDQSWLIDFLSGLSYGGDQPTEEAVYRYVATTIRALAQVGRVIIVGRGAVFLTHNMPAGVHIRLVAPEEFRVQRLRDTLQIDEKAAQAHVQRLERNRAAFYARHWPERHLMPDLFDLTLNVATIDEEHLVECILPLLQERRRNKWVTAAEPAMQAAR